MFIFTIGHSTHSLDEFAGLLTQNGINRLVDVRSVPRSRYNPQFNAASLPESLQNAGIGYTHLSELGGLRKACRDSPNMGWRNAGFRGYADYMQTPAFAAEIARLVDHAAQRHCALMCAEAVPWRCHRSLIADALTLRGIRVEHIVGPRPASLHRLTPFAKVDGLAITYPPPADELFGR